MTYHHQWLYLDAGGEMVEVFNGARTAAYLTNPLAFPPGCGQIFNVLDFGGCEAYGPVPECDTVDPYMEFPGVAFSRVETPDAAALDITGNITLIVDIAPDDWTPSPSSVLMGKYASSSNISYAVELSSTGAVVFRWSVSGSGSLTLTSSSNLGSLPAGTRMAVRVDFQPDNGGGGRTARFWVAPTHSGPWTALGAPVSAAGATSIHSGSAPVILGQSGSGFNTYAGRMYYAEVRNGASTTEALAGTAVLVVDPHTVTSEAQTTFPAVTGQTMTLEQGGGEGDLPVTLHLGGLRWEEATYSSPFLDEAPWYSEAYPESADVVGFYIEEWTGLDSGHIKRPISPLGRTPTSSVARRRAGG